jgi:hypothetical protein
MEQTLKDEIGKLIDKYSGPQLWQESVKLAIKSNPKIAQEVLAIIRDNKVTRETLLNEYGANESGSMRLGLRMPVVVEDILSVVDPDNFPVKNNKHGEVITHKLAKAFPEFAIGKY